MADFFGSIWWFVVALGLLVSFHEYGHFWVARRMGVKVLRFSVGFGKPLWMRRGKDDTEYALAAIPLGGYVKMLDEREGRVDPAELDRAFNRKSLGARTAIVAAGPIFNLIFAVLAFWVMFMIGMPEFRPVFGEPEGIAQSAGMREGDLIVAVDGRSTETMTQAGMELLTHAIDGEPVQVTVERLNGGTERLWLPLDRLGEFDQERLLESLGLSAWEPQVDPVIGTVSSGRPAEQAGFRAGDRIVAVGSQSIASWYELSEAIQEQTVPGEPLAFEIERAGERLMLQAVPERQSEEDPWVIGISWDEARGQVVSDRLFTLQHYGPLVSLGKAFGETQRLTVKTLQLLGRMVTGSA
ncbi:MAG: RIP metalloprotease RseP, partial [Candidatus Competibacterales bacterium]|nr:RIP metalloprotease RseP [Candidatus Competibacterales bacterium]